MGYTPNIPPLYKYVINRKSIYQPLILTSNCQVNTTPNNTRSAWLWFATVWCGWKKRPPQKILPQTSPPNIPPLRNKGFIFSRIKGNPWVFISPEQNGGCLMVTHFMASNPMPTSPTKSKHKMTFLTFKMLRIWTYCWWFRNPAPVEVGSLSQY